MKAPADSAHIPLDFLEFIWSEFDRITWAADARPAHIRLLYSTAISNAVKKFYSQPGGSADEGAAAPSLPSSPSTEKQT